MNSASYSAHPDEKEVLIMEGAKMFIMDIEEINVDKCNSSDPFWRDIAGRTITVIYLFNN